MVKIREVYFTFRLYCGVMMTSRSQILTCDEGLGARSCQGLSSDVDIKAKITKI